MTTKTILTSISSTIATLLFAATGNIWMLCIACVLLVAAAYCGYLWEIEEQARIERERDRKAWRVREMRAADAWRRQLDREELFREYGTMEIVERATGCGTRIKKGA